MGYFCQELHSEYIEVSGARAPKCTDNVCAAFIALRLSTGEFRIIWVQAFQCIYVLATVTASPWKKCISRNRGIALVLYALHAVMSLEPLWILFSTF